MKSEHLEVGTRTLGDCNVQLGQRTTNEEGQDSGESLGQQIQKHPFDLLRLVIA